MTREEAKELIPFYAIDALDADEVSALEDFLRDASAEVQSELRDWREIVAMLPLAVPEVAPPEHLRSQLFDRLGSKDLAEVSIQDPSPVQVAEQMAETTAKVLPFVPARRIEPTTQRWLMMAASILLAFTSVFLFWRNRELASERNNIAADLEKERKEKADIIDSLNTATRILSMTGVETPEANAKVVWDTKQQAWNVFVYKLPTPPSDKDYQLWFVTKNQQKISAKVFSTDSRGQSVLTFTVPNDVVKGLAATAVTLEPKGGSPQPTGKFYLQTGI